mmetsp:Transcript_98588/g.274313  ORF Transcript_98588/g.274313 Transcript_98588/m.274313 type:complete len:279 (-) Transcript_98588:276-1112(-)
MGVFDVVAVAADVDGSKQPQVQCAATGGKGCEMSWDGGADRHCAENVDPVAIEDSGVHVDGVSASEGQSRQPSGDESSMPADLKDRAEQGTEDRERRAGDAGDERHKMPVTKSAVKGKQRRVHWTDDVKDGPVDESPANAVALPLAIRAKFKQAVGRGKARQWLFDEVLNNPQLSQLLASTSICEIAVAFGKVRKEECADKGKVSREVSQVYGLLSELHRRCAEDTAKAAAGSMGGVAETPLKAKEPVTEVRMSLGVATVAIVHTWLAWYFRSLFHSA